MRNGQAWIVIDNVQILSSMECWLQCILDGLPLLFMFASVSMPFIVTCYHWLALLDIWIFKGLFNGHNLHFPTILVCLVGHEDKDT